MKVSDLILSEPSNRHNPHARALYRYAVTHERKRRRQRAGKFIGFWFTRQLNAR